MTKSSKAATAADKALAAIVPDTYYRVHVTRSFSFETIRFGSLVDTQIMGTILMRLLDSEHAGSVERYEPVTGS